MNYSNSDEFRRRLLLMASTPVFLQGSNLQSPGLKSSPTLPTHDWGTFGEYEYLGAGTPWKEKKALGIKGVNRLDVIAESHDRYYSETSDWPAARSIVRGPVDFGAGSAMLNASFNPSNELSWKDRALGGIAGTALIIQGTARVHPVTALPMALVDYVFY